MYKFTIEYFYKDECTKNVNTTTPREAAVFANTVHEAIEKIEKADSCFYDVAKAKFEEMVGE